DKAHERSPFGEAAAEEKRKKEPTNPPPSRPFDAVDIVLGAKVLSAELALGGKLDTFVTVRKIFDAAGVISSRATPRPPNKASQVAVAKRAAKKEGDSQCTPISNTETPDASALPIS